MTSITTNIEIEEAKITREKQHFVFDDVEELLEHANITREPDGMLTRQ